MLIALSLLLPLLVSQDVEADDINKFNGEFWNVTFCNTCSTEQSFKNAASFYDLGKVTVFNLESGQIRTYSAEMGTTFGDVTHARVATPNEAYEAFNEYEQLKNDLAQLAPQSLNSQLYDSAYTYSSIPSGPFGGICGPEGTTSSTWIPDGIFAPACSAHDQCYANGNYSKMFCDDLFLEVLETTIIEVTRNLFRHDIFREILYREALLDTSQLYHSAVVNSEAAFNAYCGSAPNSNTAFCLTGHEANQRHLDGSGGYDGAPYTGGVSYPYGGITLEYAYRCIPTRVGLTGDLGEGSWVNQYCEFVIVAD